MAPNFPSQSGTKTGGRGSTCSGSSHCSQNSNEAISRLNSKPIKRGRMKLESEAAKAENIKLNGCNLDNSKIQVGIGAIKRNLRSRTVRSVGSLPAHPVNVACQAHTNNNGIKIGMRLRNHKTLEHAPETTTILPMKKSTSVDANSKTDCETISTTTGLSDVYEFNDSDSEDSTRLSRTVTVPDEEREKIKPIPSFEPPSRSVSQITIPTSPSGRLKLTLRMKRSPVLDEVIESGNAMGINQKDFQQRTMPVYEVFRAEGLEGDSEEKACLRRTSRRRNSSTASVSPTSGMPTTTKRLRLIFGNESRTIDLEAASTSK